MKKSEKIPNHEILLDNLGKIAYTLDRTYLSRLSNDYTVLPFDEYYNSNGDITFKSNIRALKVDRWVYDKDEKVSDCFKNVLSVFSGTENTLALVINRTPSGNEMFFVSKNIGQGKNEDSRNDINLLKDSLLGNFQGTKATILDTRSSEKGIREELNFSEYKSVATVSNIPSEKSKEFISQGIDKLLNGVVPKDDEDSYCVIILAESIPQMLTREILNGYQEMATAITPFASYQFQAGENATETEGEMKSLSHSDSISHSVTKTHSVNVGLQGGVFSAIAGGHTTGLSASIFGLGPNIAKNVTSSTGANLSGSLGYGYSWGTTDTKGRTDTRTKGTNHSISIGSSENTTYTYKSYTVSDIIEKLEMTMKRINKSQGVGLWKYSSYVFSNDAKNSKNVANFLRSLTQGEESFIEPSYIQEWSFENTNSIDCFTEIQKYLQHFCHPVFFNRNENMIVTPNVNLSTTELAEVFAFPRNSIQGIPVVECAKFGREAHSLDTLKSDFEIGYSHHMYTDDINNPILISKDELTKHTFITGSTGSGKSNTIYKMIEKALEDKDVSFMVIEPTKGEYKDKFGYRDDVKVLGTNYKKTDLLRLNPFSFPDDIHVLEHIEIIIDIFNVCWPLYAAMPAILKESIERAYVSAGWDVYLSECKYTSSKGYKLYPTFDDVLKQIDVVLKESKYSDESKGNYIGALSTRIRSLTNGLYSQIFTPHEYSGEELFDSNVIIDLSRVRSIETKSLIMGLLVVKMQEYRMANHKNNNSNLRHITVLEEAHNLLKRTSTEQSSEGSNLVGKSVEMLANAIAEMRTYGEGFIIADQSPGLLDMSVIRNTNTKIILRLPDFQDRELVGRAASLNDNQIIELAKLKVGVAAVYQNNWLEPVLCKIHKSESEERKYEYKTDINKPNVDISELLAFLVLNNEQRVDVNADNIESLEELTFKLNLSSETKLDIIKFLREKNSVASNELRSKIIYNIFKADESITDTSKDKNDIKKWVESVVKELNPNIEQLNNSEQIKILLNIVKEYNNCVNNHDSQNLFIKLVDFYKNR